MASPSTTINANLNINPASVKSAQTKVQSAFNNINLNPKSVSQFSNSLGRITGQATEFKKSMDAATARVFAFGATAAVINSISQSFRALVASTIDVEKRLIEINSIFGATEKQFASFRKSIFEVAKNTGQSFAVVADGAAELARQGLSAEETAKRLNASLILTRVSGLDAVSSVNSLTAALNGFTSAGLTAESVVNKIIAVDTAFAVSAKDLAEGFQRAGSTAEDAGVSFDELLGLITSVQQKTARGGAVIGNAFKSIFTRLSRGTTISELQELGVQIDASQSGVQKLQALSTALENVGDPTVASKIKELAGGVFQINVVSAALKDLSSETSIFADAASKSAAASNEAFSKNEALNKSLAAQINSLVVGATNLAEKLGQITLAPVISDLTSLATKFTDFLSNALDEDSGNALIKGFFKGIATFIQGPGIILVTGAFLNIFKIVARFAKEGFQDLLRIGSGQERIKSIEAGIVQLLGQDATLRKQLVSTTLSQAQKEQLVIQAIQRENALLREQQAILTQLAATAARAGVTGFAVGKGFSGKKGRGFAVGGRVTGGSGTKDDVPAMLTAGEFVIRKSSVDKFGPAFMSKINEGVLPMGFNQGGKVPKFDFDSVVAKVTKIPNFTGKSKQDINRSDQLDKEEKDFLLSQIGKKQGEVSLNPQGKPLLLPSKAELNTLRKEEGKGGRKTFASTIPRAGKGGKGLPFKFTKKIDAFFPDFNLEEGQAEPQQSKIAEIVRNKILDASVDYAELLAPPFSVAGVDRKLIDEKLNSGAIMGAAGTAFEAAVATMTGIDGKGSEIARFDVPKASFTPELKKLFDIDEGFNITADGEFKISGSKKNLISFASKLLSLKGGAATAKRPVAGGRSKKFAIGGGVTGGSGTKDDVPAMLTAGEFVIKKDSVNKFGTGFMSAINEGKLPVGFNKGGEVGSSSSGGSLNAALLTSAILSFAQPVLGKSLEFFNDAADEVESLEKKVGGLKDELSKVDKEIQPEKFKSLSESIASINTQIEKANEASLNFTTNTDKVTTGIISAVFALQTFIPLLKGLKGGGASGVLQKIRGAANTKIPFTPTLSLPTLPKRAPRTSLSGVSNQQLANLKVDAFSAQKQLGKESLAGQKNAKRLSQINAELAKRSGNAGKGLAFFTKRLNSFRQGVSSFGKGVGSAAKLLPSFLRLAGPIGFIAGSAVRIFKNITATDRQDRINADLQAINADPESVLKTLRKDVVQEELDVARAKANPFDSFTGPDGGFFKGIGEVLNIPKTLTGLAEIAAINLGSRKDDTPAFGLSEGVVKSLEAGLLDAATPFDRVRNNIKTALEQLPSIVREAGLGPNLAIAFKSELDIIKQNVASGGAGAAINLQRSALQTLQSSPLLEFASPEQRRQFSTQNLAKAQQLDISQERLQGDASFQKTLGNIEATRSAAIADLPQIAGVDLSRVTKGSTQAVSGKLTRKIESLTAEIAKLENEAFDGILSDENKKIISDSQKQIQEAQNQVDALAKAADINQRSRAQAFAATAIPSILEQASTGDGQAAVEAFERFQKDFLERGGSEDDLKDVQQQFESNLKSSVDRQQQALVDHISGMQATIKEDINSRLEANKVQQQFIKDLEQNFGKNIEDFERFSDPSSILGEIPELGDRSGMFEFLKSLDVSDEAARRGSLATTSGSLASALALGSGDRLEDLVFGTGLDDKREDAAKKREALAQAQANLAAGTGTQKDVDKAKAEVQASQAEAQRIRQKAISERFTADEQALFDDINRRATSVNVDALQGQFTQSGQRFGVNALNQTLESRDEINTGADLIARIQELNQVQSQLSQVKLDPSDKAANDALIQLAAAAASEKEALESALEAIRGTEGSDELIEQEKQIRQEAVTALQDLNTEYSNQKTILEEVTTAMTALKNSLGGGGNKPDAAAGET